MVAVWVKVPLYVNAVPVELMAGTVSVLGRTILCANAPVLNKANVHSFLAEFIGSLFNLPLEKLTAKLNNCILKIVLWQEYAETHSPHCP
jgi:hypothetical protein